MTTYLVDVVEYRHLCPADKYRELHTYDTFRTVYAVISGGSCKTPVTYWFNDVAYTADCSFGRPNDRRCPACTVTIWTHSLTVHDMGRYEPTPVIPPVDYGMAAQPCPYCGTPVAAFLGVHLLCGPKVSSGSSDILTTSRHA